MIKMFGVGRLGGEPEMRYTPAGKAVTNFTVACDVGFGEYKKTQWLRFSSFGKQAEVVKEYLTKGSNIAFVAEPDPDKDTGAPKVWTNKDGVAKATLEVKLIEVTFLDKGGKKVSSDDDLEF